MDKIDLDERLASFADQWVPRIVGRLNDYELKLVKLDGTFVRHRHVDTDELFLVLDGRLTIRLPDGEVTLGPREVFVVPRGVEHQPVAEPGTTALLLEPAGVVNTGDAGGSMTVHGDAQSRSRVCHDWSGGLPEDLQCPDWLA
ncbi:MAG: cupin domain-containing protein [Nocardioidaceae bacterium]